MTIETYTARFTDRRESKRIKLLPHRAFPRADWWLWLDWNIRLRVAPTVLVALATADVMGFAHRFHDCAYEEHAACARMQKDDLATMRQQMDRYRREKFPAHFGLLECGVLLRRSCPEVVAFNEAWHAEIEAGSVRDQLSFGYAAWRTGVRFGSWPGTIWENGYCEVAA
jgi:hypothetical protein